MTGHHAALVKEWTTYCQQFPQFEHDQPSEAEVSAAAKELEASWFRQSTTEDRDSNYLSDEDLTVGEWVWLGDEEHVVTLGCAENWSLQSPREKDVCSYTFTDIARQFVLESVADQLRLLNANES